MSDLGKVDDSQVYDKVLEVDPNHTEVLNNKGNALSNHGKLEQAKTYEKAISITQITLKLLITWVLHFKIKAS